MLRFFFNRKSPVVRLVELGGVIGMACFLATDAWWQTWGVFPKIGLGAVLACYLFLRFCGSVRWYPRTDQRSAGVPLGIEIHCTKMIVAGAYALALAALWLWAGGWPWLLWLLVPALGFPTYVTSMLLWFHCTDRDETPVNFYSHRLVDASPEMASRQAQGRPL